MEEITKEEAKFENTQLSSVERDYRSTLKADLLSLYRIEERNLLQKCKLNWLRLGDENTNFFHRFLAAKKRRNLISELFDEQDKSSSSFRDIETIILNYYTSLYAKDNNAGSFPANIKWSMVTDDQNIWLTSKFTMEEIYSALKKLGKNKAPGPDGFTAEFLIKFWSFFKENIQKHFEEFYENGKLNSCIQENFICLIKKKDDAVRIKDFRPISLTTLVYKLVAKVLAERMKQIMPCIIAPTQSAFIKDRQILDPILIANEVVEDYRAKKKKGWLLKLDMEKAFDRVDWKFLKKVLKGKKFCSKWIKWLMGCISTPKFSIFINGRPRGKIKASRGIRQGDPLSPFIFILISEVLSSLIDKLYENKRFEGFIVGHDKIHVPMLQFADDTLIFCKFEEKSLDSLRDIITFYEWCSGQKINWEKSALCGINIDESKSTAAAKRLGCKTEKLPLSYLGLPLGGHPKKLDFWQPVLDKINAKLEKWRRYNLSRGRRVTLCKSVLAALPNYSMSTFLLPKKVAAKIERSIRNFFWEGHKGSKLNHLLDWKLTVKDTQDGGIGIGSIQSRNFALLAKWGWQFMEENSSLWKKVIVSIYGSNCFNWHTAGKGGTCLRSPWLSISRNWMKVECLATFKLGGVRIAFWKDPWADSIPFSAVFPRLFRIASSPNGSVANHWDSSTNSWEVSFRRLLKEAEIGDFQNLLSIIHKHKISHSQDRRIWSLEPNGSYSVKSLTKHLSSASPIDKLLVYVLWKSASPRKVNITSWIMLFGRLNDASTLQKKLPAHWLSPSICHLCMADSENLQHLFYTCRYASNCWQRLFHIFGLSWAFGNGFKDNTMQVLIGPALKKKPSLLWANATKALLSELWFERNQQVFHSKASSWLERFETAKLNASSWCTLDRTFKDYSIQDLNLNWKAFIELSA